MFKKALRNSLSDFIKHGFYLHMKQSIIIVTLVFICLSIKTFYFKVGCELNISFLSLFINCITDCPNLLEERSSDQKRVINAYLGAMQWNESLAFILMLIL